MTNKKEPLQIIIVKILLVVVIFTGVGTIIIGGGLLIGKWKSSVPVNNFSPIEKCAKAGEGSSNASLGPNAPTPRKCCEGLIEIYAGSRYEPDREIADKNGCVNFEGSGNICSDCGNGVCESWENRCNCSEDCGEESDISDWQTYRNEEFGFEVKYPEEWSTLKVKSASRGFGPDLENSSLQFGLLTEDKKWIDKTADNFVLLIWLNIHPLSQWELIKSKTHHFVVIDQNDKYVFTWEPSMTQLPSGDIPEDMLPRQLEIEKILSTFKTTN